jgi:hypothetical protein
MAQFNLKESTQVKIRKIDIISNIGIIDVTSIFQELNIYDTIFFPSMSGNIVILDSNNISGQLDFKSCFLSVELSKGEETDGPTFFKKTFRIYNQSNRTIQNPSTEFYSLHFISQELIESLTYTEDNKKVCQYFEGTYSDAANIILNNYLKVPAKRIALIQQTKGLHKFTIPNLSPFDAMEWLVTRSITSDNIPNFFFFENVSGYNFVSLTDLLNRNSVGTINFDVKNINDQNQEFYGASSVQVISQSHLGKAIKDGIFAGTVIEYDNYAGYYKETNFGYNDMTTKLNNKNSHGTSVTNRNGLDLASSFAARTITSVSPIGTQTGVVGEYVKQTDSSNANIVDDTNNWKYPRKSILSNLGQKRLRMTIPGNFIFSSGFNVDLKGFNLSMVSKGDSKDVSTNGRYIIIAARHMIKPQLHQTLLEIASESTNSPFSSSESAEQQEAKFS